MAESKLSYDLAESKLSCDMAKTTDLKFISSDPLTKHATFIGQQGDKPIVVLIHPKALVDPENMKREIEEKEKNKQIEQTFGNDRFSKYELYLSLRCEVSTICPALQNELYKFRDRKNNLEVHYETPQEYKETVEPYITTGDVGWIRDIFRSIDSDEKTNDSSDKKEEVLYHDDLFALLPDMKWDRKDMSCAYCLAILRDETIRSVRDLRSKHIKMLLEIHDRSVEVMSRVYGVDSKKIRAYFHYHPTYWWIHIHFNMITYKGAGTCVDDAIPLITVVNNLSIADDYYEKAILPLVRAPFSHEK